MWLSGQTQPAPSSRFWDLGFLVGLITKLGQFQFPKVEWKVSENWFWKELCHDLPALPDNSIALLLLLFLPSIWKLSAPWLVSRHPKVKLMGIAMRILANGRHKKWSLIYFCLFLFLWGFSSQNKPRYDCVQHISYVLSPWGWLTTSCDQFCCSSPLGSSV